MENRERGSDSEAIAHGGCTFCVCEGVLSVGIVFGGERCSRAVGKSVEGCFYGDSAR